ncbi:hypothetical protein ES703_30268 [subsurface metagenome]
MAKQLTFGFVKEIDQALADKAEQERRRWRKANADAHLEHCIKDYPPEAGEQEIIDKGIRLARFVHEFECEKCNFDSRDHTVNHLFTYWSEKYNQQMSVKMCLKDYYSKGGESWT